MPNYQNSMIYKLCCNDPNITDSYVGSTVNFKCRKSSHKSKCNNQGGPAYNNYKYQFIREHGGFENWSMILIENFPCDTKLELLKRERYWLEELGATLNKLVPSRTPKEFKKIYNETHKKEITEYNKKYHENHKKERSEFRKIYYEKHKDELNEQNKIYYEHHKEERIEQMKIYREKHKDELNAKKREKITCECGSIHTRTGKSNHLRSKKHQAFLNI